MIVTDSEELAARARMLRNHGSGDKYHYTLRGFNSRLDAIQSSILRVKLKYVDIWIKQRIENAKAYNEALSGLKAIALPAVNSPIRRHVFNYYTIRVKNALRDKLQQRLEENGISCAVYYPLCLHLQEVYKEFGYKAGDFPVAEKTQEEVLSLPMYPELTKDQIQAISSLISNFFSQ
jgi:dTDP-4-amino-4,6-dideoxygalactose transaminase